MPKEIKFRAWNWVNRTMHSWEDCLKDSLTLMSFFCEQYCLPDPKPICYLMQYTGLKDKNGKEIYEGDIVETHGYKKELGGEAEIYPIRSAVEFDTGLWSEQGFIGSGFTWSHGYDDHREVIGNIYENPELLKENQNA